MKSVFEEQRKILKERGIEISDVLLSSPKEEMEITLDYLDSTWGNAEMYLERMRSECRRRSEVESTWWRVANDMMIFWIIS